MTNNHHAVGAIGGITSPNAGGVQGPAMAMAFKGSGNHGTAGGKNGSQNQIPGGHYPKQSQQYA